MTSIYNFLVDRYSRSSPLWSVYDLQRRIKKLGVKIDYRSDLLAHLEGRSLNPELDIKQKLLNLAFGFYPRGIKIENIKKKQALIRAELIYYNQVAGLSPMQRVKGNEEPLPGYSLQIPTFKKEEEERSRNGYFLSDNEFVLRRAGRSYVIIIAPKYIDVFRLVINGYNPGKEELKTKSNKIIIAAVIFAGGLIISALIYAFAHRYEIRSNYLRIDKWTGTMQRIELKK